MASTRTTFQREIDDKLTEQFNNQLPVRQFLLAKIAELTAYLEQRYGGDVRLFVKGGSALNLLTEAKTQTFGHTGKWSDFDNQIIINPNLPVSQWYEIQFQIHNYFKQEYLPLFQKQWDLFLACDRKELGAQQQKGLDAFKSDKLANTIFDFPRYRFKFEDDQVKVETAYDVSQPLNDQYQALALELQNTSQSNMVFSAGMTLMHPLNHFDNAMTLLGPNSKQQLLKAHQIQPDELFYNQFFPPTAVALDDNVAANEAPNSSSILINTSIGKFLLYRVIVRYADHEHFNDGSKKPLSKQQWFDTTQKAFDKTLRAKFRGELLDVSIPRRDSEETIAQWQQVNTQTIHYFPVDLKVDGAAKLSQDYLDNRQNPVNLQAAYIAGILAQGEKGYWLNLPGWDYQLNENILLILEVFINISGSPHKFWKRVKRATQAVTQMYRSYSQVNRFDARDYAQAHIHNAAIGQRFIDIDESIRFIRPLVHNIDEVLYEDYLWSVLPGDPRLGTTVTSLFGEDTLLKKIDSNWEVKKNQHPNSDDSYGTYDAILNEYVTDETERTQAQQMLGFMQIYYDLHDVNKTRLGFAANEADSLYLVNGLRQALETKLNMAVTFCGLLSSAIATRTKSGQPAAFDYHYPFVELFAIGTDTVDLTGLNHSAVSAVSKKTLKASGDGRELDYFIISLKNFRLPVLLWSFKKGLGSYVEQYKAQQRRLSGIGNQIKLHTTEIQNRQRALNNPYTPLSLQNRVVLQSALDEWRKEKQDLREAQRETRLKNQLLQVFNDQSTQLLARSNDERYRLLKPAEAIKHIDSKIADTKSFYLSHWLDHVRCDFKALITTF